MKKKIILSILALILITAAVAIFFPRKNKENTPTPSTSTQPEKKMEDAKPASPQATTKNYSESSEKYKYQISINYPSFDNLADKKISDALNSQIEKDVQVEVDKYIAEARKNKITPAFGYFTGNYTYSVSPENILSVKFEIEKYLSGAASPSVLQITLSYDLASGKQMPSEK